MSWTIKVWLDSLVWWNLLAFRVSGCVDHFASEEKDAYACTRNIISTLNFHLPEEGEQPEEEPLHSSEELLGLAPRSYNYSLDVKMVQKYKKKMHLPPEKWFVTAGNVV